MHPLFGLMVGHVRLIVSVMGYMALYTCDMVLQNHSLDEAVYQ